LKNAKTYKINFMPDYGITPLTFLVIGDYCNDTFVYGKAERLSPEAPIPVFTPQRVVHNAGMAGNVARNLSALIELNADEGVAMLKPIYCQSDAVKTRYVDEKTNHYFLRVDSGGGGSRFVPFAHKDLISQAACIILSDYDKGFISVADFEYLSQVADDNAYIFLDTKKPITDEIIDFVDFVKVNEKEYFQSRQVLDRNQDKVIITLGDSGAEHAGVIYDTDPVVTMDVSGAGDSFLAALAFNYMRDLNMPLAIREANRVARICVQQRGVSTILGIHNTF
jgi:bifunctional ADP-heptose synthase (sugar kinase/adenylyltransferase)